MPSFAIKFLVDGDRSQNLFAMSSFTGSDSWDFFANPMSNRVKPFDPKEHPIQVATILKKLIEGS